MDEMVRERVEIVGAGFAGLACARAAAARGLRVEVYDRKRAPGTRLHTTGLLVKEVADEWDVPRALTRKIHGVRLYSPSLRCLELTRPGYYFLATDTGSLLAWWAQQAALAGVRLHWGAEFPAAASDQTSFLVGADGARSAVAEAQGLGRNNQFLRGVEVELDGVRGLPDDCLHVFLDSQLARGYIAWAVPGLGITQIGLACRPPARPDINRLLAKVAQLFDLSGASIVGRRAGLIPVGGPLKRMGNHQSLLVGDAAGLVSPLTAGGIHAAITGGKRAGVAIADYLLDNGPEPWRAIRPSLPSFRWKRWLRRIYDRGPPDLLYDLALDNSLFRTFARLVFFHNRGLLSPEVWRELVLQRGET